MHSCILGTVWQGSGRSVPHMPYSMFFIVANLCVCVYDLPLRTNFLSELIMFVDDVSKFLTKILEISVQCQT